MSSRRESYEVLSDCLGIPEEKIRQSFYKSANKQGFIAQEQLQDIAEEIRQTQPDAYQRLSFLLSAVREYIVSQGYDPAAISYRDLLEMVAQALRGPGIAESNALPSEREHYSEAKESQSSQSELPLHSKESFGLSGMQWPKNYRNNKEKLDVLLKEHRDELYIKFKDRETVQGSGRINMQGYYTFLQECMFIGGLAIMAHEDDIKNFFQLGDSYNRLYKVVDAYFIKNKEKGTDSQVFSVITMTFLQCFDILDNWFKIDHNVKVYDDKEQQSTIEGLLITISKYQTMLDNAQSNIEKQALKNTILGLYDKIENLSHSYREKKDEEKSPRSYTEVREEKRTRALRDIFDFFCRKGLRIIKGFTFESINRHYSGMTLEKFSVMLKDFNIKIDQFRLVELFNRVKQGLEVLSFDNFEFVLKKVAQEAELVTEIKEYKFDRSIMKNYKPDTYKQSPVPNKKDRSNSQSLKKENPSKIIQNEQEKIEALWNYMGLYDDSYKRAFSGLRSNLSVVPSEKSTLATEQDQSSRHKTIQPKSAEEDGPQTERSERRKDSATKNLKEVRFRPAPVRRDLVPSMVYRSERASANIKAKGKHLCLRPEELGPVTRSLTMQQAEHLNDNDIKRIDKEFHPLSLISQNNDDDEVYLAEYDLKNPAKNPQSEKAAAKPKLPMLYKIPPSLRRYSQMNHKTQRRDKSNRDDSFIQGAEDGKSNGKDSEINSRNDVQAIHEMMKGHELDLRGERKSVPVSSKQRSISSDVLERANQVQEFLKNRQLRMIDNILNIQAIMHERGFKTAWK